MNYTDKSNDNVKKHSENEEIDTTETMRITRILENQLRHTECGCVIKIASYELLEPDSVERMSGWI